MEYLLGLVGLLFGAVGFLWVKKQSAEALNKNVEVKDAINKSNEGVAKNKGLLDAEASKRAELEKDLSTDKVLKSIKEMEDFLNRDITKHD